MPLPDLALVPTTRPSLVVRDGRDWVVPAFALSGLVSLLLFLVGMPLLSVALVAASGASTAALLSTQPIAFRDRRILPEAIVSPESRQTYRAILASCDEIERAIAAAPRIQSSMTNVLERCHTAVELCARIAVLGNPLERYLESHDPALMRYELERLRSRAESASDERTVAALSRATAARARQLATYEEMWAMRDRIQARLELVQASLESFAALLVKIHVVEEEQLALAGDTMTERIDGIGEDLDVLESALTMDLAA